MNTKPKSVKCPACGASIPNNAHGKRDHWTNHCRRTH